MSLPTVRIPQLMLRFKTHAATQNTTVNKCVIATEFVRVKYRFKGIKYNVNRGRDRGDRAQRLVLCTVISQLITRIKTQTATQNIASEFLYYCNGIHTCEI